MDFPALSIRTTPSTFVFSQQPTVFAAGTRSPCDPASPNASLQFTGCSGARGWTLVDITERAWLLHNDIPRAPCPQRSAARLLRDPATLTGGLHVSVRTRPRSMCHAFRASTWPLGAPRAKDVPGEASKPGRPRAFSIGRSATPYVVWELVSTAHAMHRTPRDLARCHAAQSTPAICALAPAV
ncbi:hypothetical protein BC834DRAFT_147883 [Gloeopeniophorella convolvens]|nr:hypothetical protein BC834DRAFT_147883 [Gloeopeniophorella convolvens]